MQLPIRLQQAPQFASQVLQRELTLRKPLQGSPTLRLCYFSCQSYFKYLYCALHSLTLTVQVPYEVWIFSDEEMPLSKAQIHILKQLIPAVRVIDWPKSMGWGAVQIGNIWRAYALVAESAADIDIIARIDSDVFFFNDRIFRAVQRRRADFIGDGHFVDFKYCQGGCYFFRAGAVREVVALLNRQSLDAVVAQAAVPVEDVVAHDLAQLAGLNIWMTWFMMFPDELRNAGGLTPWQRWKFSCVHFVMKNKAAMIETYLQHMLPPAAAPGFLALLAID